MHGVSTLHVDDFDLESGQRLRAKICFRAFGRESPAGDNVVLLFSYYTGTHASYDPWIGVGRPIDPERHRIVIMNHFGNGQSSSPSNTSGRFPAVSIGDNARAARAVLDSLGIRTARLAAGWSLGGMQALEFAARYPHDVSAVMALCSAARCSEVNQVFLDSVAAALRADPEFSLDGPEKCPKRGLNAFGQVYAGWAYSPEFFADQMYHEFGYLSAADVLAHWGVDHEGYAARDLMSSLLSWRSADIGRHRGGLEAGLRCIRAETVLMPSSTDAYFTLTENAREVQALPNGELRVLESPLGHIAGRPGIRDREQREVDDCLRRLLH